MAHGFITALSGSQTILRLCRRSLNVNDDSKDKTLEVSLELMRSDPHVKIVNLIRYFGHEMAMTAGMDHAKYEGVVFMDADLQHPPQLVPKMVKLWQQGYDIILTKRLENKGQPIWEKVSAYVYYKNLNFLSDASIPSKSADFHLIDRKYINQLRQMTEKDRMFRGMLSWIGSPNQTVLEFVAPKRFSGETKYTLRKSFRLAIDGIVQFSIRPLRLATYLGFMAASLLLILALFTFYEYAFKDVPKTGYGTIIITIVFFGSVQLIVLGIIGEYIGRIHMETKNRPMYIADYLSNDIHDKKNYTFG
ncbi:MAG: glycosyltransferase family 2 protein [Candidatus Hodarchaeota archaeon]